MEQIPTWLKGLTDYGPIGIMLGVFMLVGLHVFKRLLDNALNQAQVQGAKLDALVTSIDQLRNTMVSGFNDLSRDITELVSDIKVHIAQNSSGVHNLPPPSSQLPPPRRR